MILKKRTKIICKCKKQKSNDKVRMRYGTCHCDTFGMSYTLAICISNYLYQYIHSAGKMIKRDDWEKIEQVSDAIKAYSDADNWDELSKEKGVKKEYLKKEKEFKSAMKWLADNWQTLWW